MARVTTVISYCSNAHRFIGKCIEEAHHFSSQILVTVCDHFANGAPENRELLEKTYRQHPDVTFLEIAYDPQRLYDCCSHLRCSPDSRSWPAMWVALSRYIGYWYSRSELILFLDADEIVEGRRFLEWISTYEALGAQRLATYLYVLRATFCSTKLWNFPLLIKRDHFSPFFLLNSLERLGAYLSYPEEKREGLLGEHPLVHHYSWVYPLEGCLQKVATWSHSREQDWPAIVHASFRKGAKRFFSDSGEYKEISTAYFDPLQPPELPLRTNSLSHVLKVNSRELSRQEIELLLS